jgi:sugar phosphate isomerase/epimerase
MAKARISIGTWAYIFNQDVPTNDFHQILHKLQDLGYDGVELGSFGPHPSPASHPTRASRQKLRKEIADHGLALSGIAVDLWAFKTPGTSILDEIPAAYLTAFLGWCVFASELDAKTIRVDTVIGPTHFETDVEGKKLGAEKGMDRIAAVWDKCSKIAADYGLNVCWEFEPGFAFNKPSDIVRVQ